MFDWLRDALWEGMLQWRRQSVIGAPTQVSVSSSDGLPVEELLAEVNTSWDYSVIDEKLARELGLFDADTVVEEVALDQLGGKRRPLILVSFQLAGVNKRSRWAVVDRQKEALPIVIGRRDLAGFLVQISEIV